MNRHDEQTTPGSASNWADSIDWQLVLGSDRLGLDRLELSQFIDSLSRHSPRCLRLRSENPIHPLPFATHLVPWHRRGRWVSDPQVRPGAYLNHAAGDYYIQDAASLLATTLCQINPGDQVCDVCAAPGGKATGLLEQLAGTGVLVANEVIRGRLEPLQLALCRSGWGNHVTVSCEVERMAQHFQQLFDCVLVDAPCSGQSMLAKDKQSLAAFSQPQIQHSAARQRRILQAASELVRPGGRLVYSTCTFSIQENEHRIEDFLQMNSHWQIAPLAELSAWSSPALPGSYRLWPHRDQCDGAFAVALVRRKAQEPQLANRGPERPLGSNAWKPWKGRWSQLDFLSPQQSALTDYAVWQKGGSAFLFPQLMNWMIPMAQSGITLFQERSQRIEPSYGSAVLSHPDLKPTLSVELTDQEARKFMAGESLYPTQADQGNGWCRVQWQGRSLAWGKLVANVLKNHLPKMLRQSGFIDL